eukprot:COSAG06_NODE_1597_length_8977_cov_17.069836_2_plen_83_part_00
MGMAAVVADRCLSSHGLSQAATHGEQDSLVGTHEVSCTDRQTAAHSQLSSLQSMPDANARHKCAHDSVEMRRQWVGEGEKVP